MNSFLAFLLTFLGFTVTDVEQNKTFDPGFNNPRQQQNVNMELTDPTKSDDDTDIYRLNNGHSEIG